MVQGRDINNLYSQLIDISTMQHIDIYQKQRRSVMKKLQKIIVLMLVFSLFICEVGYTDVKAVSGSENAEDEVIILDDDELDSWEEEDEVWEDGDEEGEEEEDEEFEGEEDTYVDDTISVTSEIKEKWTDHYNAEVTITNLTDTGIDDWIVTFDYKDEIEHIWNAEIIAHENDTYTIKCLAWNQDIKANGSVTFGITVKYTDTVGDISNAYLANDINEVDKEKYSATYTQYSAWPGYVSGEMKIQNNSEEQIEDWKIEVTTNLDIQQIWNADIESKYLNEKNETTYIIKNKEYNQNISAGGSCSFGFIAQTTEDTVKVEEERLFSMNIVDDSSDEEDWEEVEELEGLTEDDFLEYSDYLDYLALQEEESSSILSTENHMGIMAFSARATEAAPAKTDKAKVTDLYRVVGEKSGYRKKAFQNYCMGKIKGKNGEKYAYSVVHCGKNAVMFRMKLTEKKKKDGTTEKQAQIIGRMQLNNFGHTQSLESFVYEGKEYFLLTGKTYELTEKELKEAKKLAKKQNKKLSQVVPNFCTQIACVKYNNGSTVNVKKCGRLVGVTYSNKKRTKFGRLNRVDIGLKSDSRIVIWKRRKSDSAVQVSTFGFSDKVKKKLVNKKTISFANSKLLTHKTSFTMKRNSSSYILPKSMQSIDQGGDNTIYIASGKQGESQLCIAECSAKKGEYRKKYVLDFGNDFPIQKNKEIEGMHSKDDQLQFVIADVEPVKVKNKDGKKVKIKRQYICAIDK